MTTHREGFEIYDDRFAAMIPDDAEAGPALHRHGMGGRSRLFLGGRLPAVERHPERPHVALLGRGRCIGLSTAGGLHQRPLPRPRRQARELRARQSPRQPHRALTALLLRLPTTTRATGSTPRTTSWSSRTERYGSPIRHTAYSATVRGTRQTASLTAASCSALSRIPARSKSWSTRWTDPTALPSRLTRAFCMWRTRANPAT